MVKSVTRYTGQLHCEITHEPSATRIVTDAPKDNNGKGESFSPTDLVGAALGSCILTTMAMVADRDGVAMVGARAEVQKEMSANPRRIAGLHVQITLPASIPENYRAKLEAFAHACPVHRSLHPEMKIPVVFNYV